MMMGDGEYFSFGNQLRQGQTERNIHGYGHSIFHNEQVHVKTTHKLVQMLFQMVLDALNGLRRLGRTGIVVKQIRAQLEDGGMVKVGFRHEIRALLRPF